MQPRIQQQIRATPGGGQRDVVKALLGTVRLIAAWILATRPNYTKMPLDEALGAAEAWSRVPIPARSHDVVHDFGDGWAWVRVPVDEYAAAYDEWMAFRKAESAPGSWGNETRRGAMADAVYRALIHEIAAVDELEEALMTQGVRVWPTRA